ncbi:hypothetical protein [Streptomyces sp. DASNCL29]|nr:hypothetical protein [Streptomyces sp. DASNCL29]
MGTVVVIGGATAGVIEDPYQAYRPSNIVGRAWHGEPNCPD